MSLTIDQILPSLQSLGVLGYWLIGLASALEAFFLTGVLVPGTLIVEAGGMLVQRGLLDYLDLVWFVAIGSVLGSELSYWTGRLAMTRLPGRQRIERSRTFARAEALFRRRGGLALLFGRFMGPAAGLVPLAAAMAGVDRRTFVVWNVVGSIPYALVHVAVGYFLAGAMGRFGGSLTRVALLAGVLALVLVLLWGLLYSVLRLLPLAFTIVAVALRRVGEIPPVARGLARHPVQVRWVAARFDRTSFAGLPLTVLGVLFLYVGAVWIDSAFDFLSGEPVVAVDLRLAELIHHFQSPLPVLVASHATAAGGWQVVVPLVAAGVVWLVSIGRHALASGLLVSVVGNAVSVALLKQLFDRPRSPLGYYVETSSSFPSGHAAASVAVYGMLMYVLMRTGRLRADIALLAAGFVAFAIGVSRVYLVEHYLSDVLNGWLVGLLWVIVGIAIAEWLASRQGPDDVGAAVRGWRKVAGLAVAVALTGLAAVDVWHYDHARNVPVRTADVVVSDLPAVAAVGDFSATTESLLGSPLRPISLVVLARDEATLAKAMLAAGWAVSSPPTPGLVVDALFGAVQGREDPTIETVSHFWLGEPNDLAFAKPSDAQRARPDQAVRARFWRTVYVTPDGLRAFAGAFGIDETGDAASKDRAAVAQPGPEPVVGALLGHGATLVAQPPASARAGEPAVVALP